MAEGLIVKALSGYYYVLPDGECETKTIRCRARGIFKKIGVSPLVGDRVVFSRTENDEGTVDEILPRHSELIRPPIANADLAVLVFSVVEPAIHLQLLDKFLVHVEKAGLDAMICLTKSDLLSSYEGEPLETISDEVLRLYSKIGYDVVMTSAEEGSGTEDVASRLSGRISVFAGQSGVGKSSLLNAMIPGLTLQTNEISMKLGRGRHTTRHVELIKLAAGGFVADTPGFSQLDFTDMEPEELDRYFREFRPLSERCRFRGCTHHNEPDCQVIEAEQDGGIASSRYAHYIQFLTEIKEKERRY